MINWKDVDYINEIIKESKNKTDVLNKLKLKNNGGNYNTLTYFIRKNNIPIDHFIYKSSNKDNNKSIRYSNLLEILIEKSPYKNNGSLKERLYKEGLKERKCELCGQDEIWKGVKISLILDHVNGVNNDNRIDNLRIVCPNCNAGLPTHCRGSRENNKYYCECGKEKKRTSNKCIECYNKNRNDIKITKHYCKCGNEKSKQGELCITCYNKSRRTVERPPHIQLLEEISSLGYTGTGKKYNVSDNAIRKWKKNYENQLNFGS